VVEEVEPVSRTAAAGRPAGARLPLAEAAAIRPSMRKAVEPAVEDWAVAEVHSAEPMALGP
jgi:hypothetical protein